MHNGMNGESYPKNYEETHGMSQSGTRSYYISQPIYWSQIILIDEGKTDYGAQVNCQMTAP